MAVDFTKYTDIDMDDIPLVTPSLPAGHYQATIQGWKYAERNYDKRNGGPMTPVVELTFKVVAADDDIEPEDLPEGGGVGKLLTRDYRLNDPDKAGHTQVRRLAEITCGLPVKGYKFPDVLEELKGQMVKIYNDPRPAEGDNPAFPRVTRVLPAN